MKQQYLSTVAIFIICLSLSSQCNATFPRYYHQQAHAQEASNFPHASIFNQDDNYGGGGGGGAGAPAPSPSSGGHGYDTSSMFYSSFSDILRGTLRGHALTMPDETPNSPNSHNNALREICRHTDYPDVCVSTIAPHLSGENCELNMVLQASITACTAELKLTIEKLKRHENASPPENLGAVMFVDCKVQYGNALENLQKASNAATAHDLGTVTIMLSSVMADVATCESGFQDLESSSSSFKAESDGLVGIMAGNSLAIAHMVPHQ